MNIRPSPSAFPPLPDMAANPVVTGMEVFSQPGGHADEDLFGRVCVCAGMELHRGERQESQK